MSSFTNELKVKPTEDGKMWILLEDFEYYLGDLDSGVSIKVPAGFITDFASVPQFLWWILPPFGKYTKPAVLHDYLYRKTKFNREICDGIFLEAMEVMNVPVWQRLLLYLGVRIGGWVPYRKYKKIKMKYKVIYLPEDLSISKIFSSYKEACKYIENYCCGYCRKAVKVGYYECEYKDGNQIIKDKIPVSDILDTPCGAEWIIEEIPDD